MNTSISVLLEHKGKGTVSVPPTVTVTQAAQEMNRRKVGSVLVLEGGRLVGIFTERDVLWRVVAAGLDPKTSRLSQVMTPNPVTVAPDAPIQHVMDVFTEKRFRHMPVVDGGRLLGLISIGDVLRWAADVHRQEAEQLKQYITGGYPS
ncbi:MAG TPA: CBS domain-containing protein [Opitutaceae bacterium]|jgi:CBS domain-containing protein|nr:CBS domain-containing protein [Opitutaceae bacterium]